MLTQSNIITTSSQNSSSSVPVIDTLHTTSLFKDNLLTKKTDERQLHYTKYDYGVAGILLFAFILFVWLFASNRKRLTQHIKAFYINRHTNQLGRDEISLGNRVSVFLSMLFVITVTLFIVQVADQYSFYFSAHRSILYFEIALIICFVYGIKIMVVRIFGFIFQKQKEAGDYAMMIFLFCNILGLFLLPIVVCLAFVKEVSPLVFIYLGFGVSALFLCIRLIRGVIIGINSIGVSRFYLFLYLCTFEILPFVIMVKLFFQNINNHL
ncbi:MAG: DUF4271 domain-containing protein [Bacteroidetes bacterium]|nr:DUF4271 domain-containing protein [Bacteroidota bacterium]